MIILVFTCTQTARAVRFNVSVLFFFNCLATAVVRKIDAKLFTFIFLILAACATSDGILLEKRTARKSVHVCVHDEYAMSFCSINN